MRDRFTPPVILLAGHLLLGCGKAGPPPVPPPPPVALVAPPVVAIVTPPSGVTLEQAAEQLLVKKDVGALKALLAVNAVDGSEIQKMGSGVDWPRQMNGIGTIDLVRNAQLVTVQGKKYLVAVCTQLTPRPPQFAHMGPGKVGRAYVFTPQGALVSTFGPRAQECDVTVLTLGTSDMWFVWVKKNINTPTTVESDIYLLNEPSTPAVKVRHPTNGVGFTANAEQAKVTHSTFIFSMNTPTDLQSLPKSGVIDASNSHPLTHAIGRDGKEYPRSIAWDSEKQVFRGPGLLKRATDVVYEVNETASGKFVAIDIAK